MTMKLTNRCIRIVATQLSAKMGHSKYAQRLENNGNSWTSAIRMGRIQFALDKNGPIRNLFFWQISVSWLFLFHTGIFVFFRNYKRYALSYFVRFLILSCRLDRFKFFLLFASPDYEDAFINEYFFFWIRLKFIWISISILPNRLKWNDAKTEDKIQTASSSSIAVDEICIWFMRSIPMNSEIQWERIR